MADAEPCTGEWRAEGGSERCRHRDRMRSYWREDG